MTEATPTLSLSGPSTIDSFGDVSVVPTFNDPGGEGAKYIQVNWGDGSSTFTASGTGLTHQYTTPGAQFTITAQAVSGDGTYTATPLTVGDDDPNPVVSVAAVYPDASEQDNGFGTIQLTRSDDGQFPLTVGYTLTGTAAPATDYVVTDEQGNVLNGTITLPPTTPGQSADTSLLIRPIDDSIPEWTETATVTLNPGSGYSVGSPNSGTVDIQDNDLGVRLDNGSGNIVLRGSSDGTQNLVPLYLNVPQGIEPGATVTLSVNSPDKVDVWTMSSPGASDTPLLGGSGLVSSYTWTEGQSGGVPTELWVGATAGSATVGDIQFALADSDAGTTPPPTAPTSSSATTQPTTAVKVAITSWNDPNGDGLRDVTGKTRNWLVGQLADLSATIEAPPGFAAGATYSWSVPGNTLYDYVETASSATAVPLAAENGRAPGGQVPGEEGASFGTSKGEVKFFWVSTTAADTGPDHDTVTLRASLAGGVPPVSVAAAFDVYTPSDNAATTWRQGKVGPFLVGRDPVIGLGPDFAQQPPMLYGISRNAAVSTRQPNGTTAFGQGEFRYTQVVKDAGSAKAVKGVWQQVRFPGAWVLDTRVSVQPGRAADQHQITPFNAPNGDRAWMTDAGPGFTVDSPAAQVGIPDLTDVQFTQDFNTYLMYKPPGTDSRWVPLEMQAWSYLVAANQASGWSNPTNSWQHVPNWGRQTSEPAWSNVVTGATYWR